jgi:hypothetical protein
MQLRLRHNRLIGAATAALSALAFAVPAVSAQGAKPIGPTVLAGFSSQHWPSFFKLAKDQRTLLIGSVALDMNCTSGGHFVLEDEFANVPIGRGGRLRDSWAEAPTKFADGYTVGGSGAIVVTLDRRRSRLQGVWRVHQTIISPTGQIDECDSGPVRITATG